MRTITLGSIQGDPADIALLETLSASLTVIKAQLRKAIQRDEDAKRESENARLEIEDLTRQEMAAQILIKATNNLIAFKCNFKR